MKDLDYVYDKFEGLLLFLQAEVNGVDDWCYRTHLKTY